MAPVKATMTDETKRPLVIDAMYAFVVIDENGDEGIPAVLNHGAWLPLVGGDTARVESLMDHARQIAQHTGRSMKIYRFTNREQIGEVNP